MNTSQSRDGRLRWNLAALLIFTLTLVILFGGIWRRPGSEVPGARSKVGGAIHSDLILETWIVARNAFTWSHAPSRMFDAEHCAPYEKTLTLCLPMLTMGLLGVPALMTTQNPAAVYNFSLAVSLSLAFVAMYLLIRRWTGLPAAAIAAALLYTFHPIRIAYIHHPTVWDTTWTVFAIFFAERLFAEGRWKDAIGLGLSCALQIGTSFYPLMVATLLALPFVPWLLVSRGFRKVRAGQLVLVAALVAVAVIFVLFPYLAAGIERPESYSHFFFASWEWYWPGQPISPGWILIAFAALAVFRRRSGLKITGDPRWALLIGAAGAAFFSVGSDTARILESLLGTDLGVSNPYLALGKVIPGLRSVRGILRLSTGVHLVSCVLGGIGVAVLIRRLPRFRVLVTIALFAVVWAEVMRPGILGLEPLYELRGYSVQVSQREIDFFEELERRGNSGPIFEFPIAKALALLRVDQERILRSFYHRRRTSACMGSYRPGRELHREIASRLPEPDAVRMLRDLGFTTLVVEGPLKTRRFVKAVANTQSPIRPLHITARRAAFEIIPDP